jgi:hypothetical protein
MPILTQTELNWVQFLLITKEEALLAEIRDILKDQGRDVRQ